MEKKYIQSSKQTNGFNVTGYEKFIDMVSDSTLQTTFKKVPAIKFWCSVKEKYTYYMKGLLKCSSFFQLQIWVRPDFLQVPSAQRAYCNRLNAGGMRYLLSSVKSDINKTYKKCETMLCSIYIFVLVTQLFCIKICYLCLQWV